MTAANYISLAALTISVIMLFVNLGNSKRSADAHEENAQEKQEKKVAEQTTIQIALENIKDMLSDIKKDIRSVREDTKENKEAIIRMQESLKSEHKRLDEHDRRLGRIEEALRARGRLENEN